MRLKKFSRSGNIHTGTIQRNRHNGHEFLKKNEDSPPRRRERKGSPRTKKRVFILAALGALGVLAVNLRVWSPCHPPIAHTILTTSLIGPTSWTRTTAAPLATDQATAAAVPCRRLAASGWSRMRPI